MHPERFSSVAQRAARIPARAARVNGTLPALAHPAPVPERERTTTMPCFDARALETDPDGLALLREVLGPPKVCASFGPETHAKLTRDEGWSFSGLEARERAGVALPDPPPQAAEFLPSNDLPGDVIEQDGRPEIGPVVERPTPLEAVGNGDCQGGDCCPGPLEAALTRGGKAPPPRGSPSPKSLHGRHQ